MNWTVFIVSALTSGIVSGIFLSPYWYRSGVQRGRNANVLSTFKWFIWWPGVWPMMLAYRVGSVRARRNLEKES